ncbi:pyridoxal-dependent aspartate 1-decarboxylase PanP [Thermodesulfobacteriota bacterium]
MARQTDHPASHPELVACWDSMKRVFIMPESDETKKILIKYMEQILFGLHDFLQRHVGITEEIGIKELSPHFMDSVIPRRPEKALGEVITELIKEIAPHAVNVASPYFIGHMTSAMPFFMVHLQTIVAALNQNVVKLETSKVTSIVEKQVLAKIHRLIYDMNEAFYLEHVQNGNTALGGFAEDGTLANITALWVARNKLLGPCNGFAGVEKEGIAAAYQAHGIERAVVLVSQFGHYSLRKAGGILGIGNRNLVPVGVDSNNRIDLNQLRQTLDRLASPAQKTRVMAVVGIAGATETGGIDPLAQIAEICTEYGIHFHADAAWGGPTLLSEKYRHLLNGIERADSVTIDGHKQFYMPMTCGMVYFKDPVAMDAIAYYAHYVNRRGSVDLGIRSIAGSRASVSLILDGALKIMGAKGYALLLEHNIETAHEFAREIEKRPDFELITSPQLNILTYRYCPHFLQERIAKAEVAEKLRLNQRLNRANIILQRLQREAGKSFVSRTTLRRPEEEGGNLVVLRSVIMNPMTTMDIIREILDEQEEICRKRFKAWGFHRMAEDIQGKKGTVRRLEARKGHKKIVRASGG